MSHSCNNRNLAYNSEIAVLRHVNPVAFRDIQFVEIMIWFEEIVFFPVVLEIQRIISNNSIKGRSLKNHIHSPILLNQGNRNQIPAVSQRSSELPNLIKAA